MPLKTHAANPLTALAHSIFFLVSADSQYMCGAGAEMRGGLRVQQVRRVSECATAGVIDVYYFVKDAKTGVETKWRSKKGLVRNLLGLGPKDPIPDDLRSPAKQLRWGNFPAACALLPAWRHCLSRRAALSIIRIRLLRSPAVAQSALGLPMNGSATCLLPTVRRSSMCRHRPAKAASNTAYSIGESSTQ